MFDKYYKGLTPKEKGEFAERSGVKLSTIRNAYLPKDPLKRRVPRPETLLRMIVASDNQLILLGLLDYFTISVVMELCKADEYQRAQATVRKQRNISILDVE